MDLAIDLRPGLKQTRNYNAWKFPGGEIHFTLNEGTMQDLENIPVGDIVTLIADAKTPDGLIFLGLMAETIKKTFGNDLHVHLGYMPYQQADREFSEAEPFSLKFITSYLNSLPVDAYYVFDPHSDVTAALLKNIVILDNSEFISEVISHMVTTENTNVGRRVWIPEDLIILSPDAGAYKKIFKLCEKIKFPGRIETANKYRDTTDGSLHTRLSGTTKDYQGKTVLIIDDICMGGRTFIELAKELKKKKAGRLHLAVSHGIFSNGFKELRDYFTGIYTTDSHHSYSHFGDQVDYVYEM